MLLSIREKKEKSKERREKQKKITVKLSRDHKISLTCEFRLIRLLTKH